MKTEHNTIASGLYAHYGTYYKPFWATKSFIITAIIISLLILTYLIMRIMKAWRGKKVLKSWDVALEQLNDLESLVHAGKLKSQEFYVRLTGIIKIYLHARYGYIVYDKTDQELSDFLTKSEISHEARTLIENIFERVSSLKFSEQTDLPEAMLQAIECVRNFVNLTIIPESTSKK